MKPHIAQTVADLRAEADRLNQMISVLERYGAETDPAAPQSAVQPTPPKPATPVAATDRRRRITAPNSNRGKGLRPLVEQVAHKLGTFTLAELKAYIGKHHGNFANGIATSSWSSALTGLAKAGVVSRTAKGWATMAHGNQVEAKYREFRDSMNTTNSDDKS